TLGKDTDPSFSLGPVIVGAAGHMIESVVLGLVFIVLAWPHHPQRHRPGPDGHGLRSGPLHGIVVCGPATRRLCHAAAERTGFPREPHDVRAPAGSGHLAGLGTERGGRAGGSSAMRQRTTSAVLAKARRAGGPARR